MSRNPDDTPNLPEPTDGLPTWITLMREAAIKCVKPEDIEQIVKAQVDKAKAGDEKALKFVFEQVLGGASMKGATFIQNVYPEVPEKPTHCLPGSNGKISKMQQRVAAGRGVFSGEDEEPDQE